MSASYERLLWSPPTHAVVTSGDALVQLWERATPVDGFRAILAHCEERKRATPARPLWMIAVLGELARLPDGGARKVSARFPDFFTEFALVVEGSGFRASAARAIMASISMMSSRRAKAHIVASVPEACHTLAGLSRGALDAPALVRTIGAARDALRR